MKIETQDYAPAISKPQQSSPSGKSDDAFGRLLTTPASVPPRAAALAVGVVAPRSDLEQRGQVFGFGELGVFGRYGARANPGRTQEAPGGDPAAVLEDRAEPHENAGPVMAADHPPAEETADRAVAGQTETPVQFLEAAPASGTVLVADSVAASPEAESFAEQIAEPGDNFAAGPDRTPAEIPSQASDSAPISLVVSEENGALAIVARAGVKQDESPELRRRMEKTAAEFGMQVRDIHLNGSAAPSFTSILGGNSGSRIR